MNQVKLGRMVLTFVTMVTVLGCGKKSDIPAVETQASTELKVTLKNESSSETNSITSQKSATHPVVADFYYQPTQNGTIQFGGYTGGVSSNTCPLENAVNHELSTLNSDGTVSSSVVIDSGKSISVTANTKYIWRSTMTPPAGCDPTIFGLSYNFKVNFSPSS